MKSALLVTRGIHEGVAFRSDLFFRLDNTDSGLKMPTCSPRRERPGNDAAPSLRFAFLPANARSPLGFGSKLVQTTVR